MAEVAGSVCIQITDSLRSSGVDVEPFLAGTSLDLDLLRRRGERVAWTDFASFLRRIARAFGGAPALEQVALGYVRTQRPGLQSWFTAVIGSVRPLYFLGAQFVGPNLFQSTRGFCEDLPDGRIRQTVEILDGYDDSPEFFHLVRGALRVMPEGMGQARADVELELAPRRGIYLIRAPERPSLRGRIRSLFQAPRTLPAAIDELALTHSQMLAARANLAAARNALDARTRALQVVHALCENLSRHREPLALSRSVVECLRSQLGIGGVVIWSQVPQSTGALREIFAAGPRAGSPALSIPLRLGDRSVGRLDLHSPLPKDVDSELLDEAASLLALALDRALGRAALAEQAEELRRALASRDQAVENLNRAQRLEAVGRIAGGVAHDLNNVLTAIGGYAELARNAIDSAHPAQADLEAIDREGARASTLIRQILAFSRRQIRCTERLDLNAALVDLIPMLRQILPDNVKLVTQLEKELWPVSGDAGQVEQIAINLVLNARDALARGGCVTLSTRNEPASAAASDRVLLCVEDDGIGMDAATASHAFDPFFTTKPAGKGSGLGLSTVLGMVEQSGGTIELRSQPERGTRIEIRLPRASGPAPLRASREDGAAPRGHETALVVEDDANVRAVVQRVLERSGYRAFAAANAEEALAIAGSERGRIDLLISDIVMPGMDGRELARRLRAQRPELLGTLLVSGYANDDISPPESGEPFALLRKPFTPRALLQAIRQLLDSH
jgi:hypothetical protein